MKRILCSIALLLLLPSPGFSTSLIWMDVAGLTRNSTSVVRGTIVGQTTLAEEPGVSLNQVTLRVEESFKGDMEGTVTVQNPGFDGAPEFVDGEEVILFLYSEGGTHVITGLQQGCFKTVADDQGVKVLGRGVPSRNKSIAGARSVDALVSEIRSAAKEGAR